MSEGHRIVNILKSNKYRYDDCESDDELHVIPDNLYKNIIYNEDDSDYEYLSDEPKDENDPVNIAVCYSHDDPMLIWIRKMCVLNKINSPSNIRKIKLTEVDQKLKKVMFVVQSIKF